jgi:hypothetical protein
MSLHVLTHSLAAHVVTPLRDRTGSRRAEISWRELSIATGV